MKILLWILQIMLALHTIMGAVWKFSNSEQTVGSLNAIPHNLWLAFSVLELIAALGLILGTINKYFIRFIPPAAIFIALEMLFYCGLTIFSGYTNYGQIIYWLVVAVICGFIAFGRLVLKPL